MNSPYLSRRVAQGFTLIELLTVIAIIGILAAILIPTVSAVRKSARAAADVSLMRQFGAAMAAYASDNKDAINVPIVMSGTQDAWNNNYWTRAAPYLGRTMTQGTSIALDFQVKSLPRDYYQTSNSDQSNKCSYMGYAGRLTFATNKGLNSKNGATPELRFRKLTQYSSYLSVTPYIAVGTGGFSGDTADDPIPAPEAWPGGSRIFWPYKGTKTIMTYLDGHTAYRSTKVTTEECFREWSPNST